MEKLLADLRNAADNLKMVAHGLRTPLDTSGLEQAVQAVEDAHAKATKLPEPFRAPPETH